MSQESGQDLAGLPLRVSQDCSQGVSQAMSYLKLKVLLQAHGVVGRIQIRIQTEVPFSCGLSPGPVPRSLPGGLLLGALITWQFTSSNSVGESLSPGR